MATYVLVNALGSSLDGSHSWVATLEARQSMSLGLSTLLLSENSVNSTIAMSAVDAQSLAASSAEPRDILSPTAHSLEERPQPSQGPTQEPQQEEAGAGAVMDTQRW